jgi:hypothetical protein
MARGRVGLRGEQRPRVQEGPHARQDGGHLMWRSAFLA